MPPKKKRETAGQEEAPSSKRQRGGAGSGAGGRGARGVGQTQDAAVDDSSAPGPSSPKEKPDEVPKRFWEQMQCPICMEIFHNPVALLPCLHNFCAACAIGCQDCHVCRVGVEEAVRNHSLANFVEIFLEANPHRRRTLQDLAQLDEAVAASEASAAAAAGGQAAHAENSAIAAVLKARKTTLTALQQEKAQYEKAQKRTKRTIKTAEDALGKELLATISDTKLRASFRSLVNALVHNEMTCLEGSTKEFCRLENEPAPLEAATAIAHGIGYCSSLTDLSLKGGMSGGTSMPTSECMEVMLRHGVAKSSSLMKLTMFNDCNCMTDAEARELEAALKACNTLQELSLRYEVSRDQMPCVLAAVLGVNSCRLRKLDLHSINMGDEGAGVLAKKLKVNTVLRELGLRGNLISDAGAGKIAEALKKNWWLHKINLQGNLISDAGAGKIAEALKKNYMLHKINLEDNRIADKGAIALARGVENSSQHIQRKDEFELNLAGNRIADVGVAALAKMLKSNGRLRKLWLGRQRAETSGARLHCLTSKGASALADALKCDMSLEVLDLGGNRISDVGAIQIAEALKKNFTLLHVNLDECEITDKGAGALALALKLGRYLQRLELAGNKIANAGAKKLADALEHNYALKVLRLSGNAVGDKGAGALARSLEVNSLGELDLSHNKVTDAGAKKLASSLALDGSVLATLNLRGNNITAAGATRLQEAWTGQEAWAPDVASSSDDISLYFSRNVILWGADEEEDEWDDDDEVSFGDWSD